MKIETDEFILRNWQDEDAERLALIANNKKIFNNLRDVFPNPYSIDDAKEYITFAKKEENLSTLFAIEIDGKFNGSLAASVKNDVYRKNIEIGYYLAEECWGKGIMTKIVKAFVKYLFAL